MQTLNGVVKLLTDLYLVNLSAYSGERVLCFHGPLLYEAKVCCLVNVTSGLISVC